MNGLIETGDFHRRYLPKSAKHKQIKKSIYN